MTILSCFWLISMVLTSPISIDLSISWQKEKSFDLTEEEELVPYLVIKYSNESEKDYYLPSLLSTNSVAPLFSMPSVFEEEIRDSFNQLPTDELVSFYNGSYRLLYLDFSDTKNVILGLEEDIGNGHSEFCRLCDYDLGYYYARKYNLKERQNSHFKPQELRYYRSMKKSGRFIFLKAGDSFEQKVDMSFFHRARMRCLIIIDDQVIPEEYYCFRPGGVRKSRLPENVRGYHLYKDTIIGGQILLDCLE